MPDTHTHNCTIQVNSTVYGFCLYESDPWRELDINEFAPQVAGGAKGYGDLSLFSIVAQEDWRHGFGFVYHEDEAGYCYSGDGVDARFQGLVQLASAKNVDDECGHEATAYCEFNNNAYASFVSGGVRQRTADATWADDVWSGGSGATVRDLISTGDYLVATVDGAAEQVQKRDTSGTWSVAGNAGNPPYDFHHLALGGGRIWSHEDAKNLVHYASATDLSDWEGDGASDTNYIVVGPGTVPITAMQWFNGQMHIGREDGLWRVREDDIAEQIIDFRNRRNASNFEGMCVGPDFRLYFPARDQVFRWTGYNLENITPGHWGEFSKPALPGYASGERPPYTIYTLFHDMSTDGTHIYVIGRTNDTSYHEDLLVWTGSGWHKLYELVTDGSEEVYACAFSPLVSRLFINKSITSGTTTTYMVKRNSGSPLPFDDYPTSGNHYLYSSKIHLGLLEIVKCLDRLDVRSFNLQSGAPARTIDVDYQIDDDGTWRDWGTANTSPYQQLDAPSSNNTAKIIQFRYNLQTASSSESPYLDSTAFRLMPRPDTYYGLTLNIKVAEDITRKDGTMERLTSAEDLKDALHACRDSQTPVTVTLPLGISITGYVTSYNLSAVQYGIEPQPSAIGTLSIAQI